MSKVLITHAETATSAAPDLTTLWDTLIGGIVADRPDSARLLPAAGGPGPCLPRLTAAALGPVLPRLRAAANDRRRGRPVVLVSTVLGSRPYYDHSHAEAGWFGIRHALTMDVAVISDLVGEATDVIGIGSGGAAGTTAVGIARGLIACGRADFVVCLGIEIGSLEMMLPGEGWGVLVLESDRWAREPVGSVLGYGEASDGYDLTARSPVGAGLTAAVTRALAESGSTVDDIGWICAQGTGTPVDDARQARIYGRLFGSRRRPVPCVSLAGVTGYCRGASGIIEAAVACRSLREVMVPANSPPGEADSAVAAPGSVFTPAAPMAMDPESRVLSTSFGFGGAVSAIVIGQV
ncbi:hypothetical protein AB0N05_01955 [Nocardia sp. NPDC051030]|uniref:hypothetical protein n=1 Tax=Nocardia sp. NPDC051030 TaxID=3155162 RepID=UPI0034430E86